MTESEDPARAHADQVRTEWTAAGTIAAWRRWHAKTACHFAPMTEALLARAELRPGHRVLDLASGSGEPAISIASLVGPSGGVTATDLSHEMLALAEEHAGNRDGLRFQQADVHALPFADGSFQVATCRLGVMYFWDCGRALREVLRVLEPGGRAVFVAWGPLEDNVLARTVLAPFVARLGSAPPAPPAGAPHPFRFAQPGSLSRELVQAGFDSVREHGEVVSCPWPGPPDELWRQVYDMAVPLRPFFDGFAAELRTAAIGEVIRGLEGFYDGVHTDPTTSIVVATGTKPI